jgi:hypothetical protein
MKQLEDTRTLDMYGEAAKPDAGIPTSKPLGIPKTYAARKAAGYGSVALTADAVEILDEVRAQLVIRKGLRLSRAQTVGYVMYEYRRTLEGAK